MVEALRTSTTRTDYSQQFNGQNVSVGVQGKDGKLNQQQLSTDKPIDVNGVQVSLDDKGQVTVKGTDKAEQYSIADGAEYGVPGSTIVGVEGNGDPVYFAIPNKDVTGIKVDGAGGTDDYWAPINDDFTKVSIHDEDDGIDERAVPDAGSLPFPSVDLSGAPAGQGLTVGPDGWPKNTVQDAAGWKIVPEGNSAWSIYAPDQKPGDTPHTRVHGDPHVTEKDDALAGKTVSWDFTKDSDFVLPSGTRIFADTDYDAAKGNGQSITQRLVITNGMSRIDIDGIAGDPKVGELQQDGYEWRALHLTNPEANDSSKYGEEESEHDAFYLRGDNDHVHWVRERDGEVDGVVTGGTKVDANGHQIYDQTVDPTLNPEVARELRPAIGSRAWGNQLRSQLNDAESKWLAEQYGQDYGSVAALQNAYGIHAGHIQGEYNSDLLEWLFGSMFDMTDLLRSDSDFQRQTRQSQNDRLMYI